MLHDVTFQPPPNQSAIVIVTIDRLDNLLPKQ
jgi:hypothetical protein